jgi:hypothetical protein
MHDFTARIIHEDRMAGYVREADAWRLAREARQGQPMARQGQPKHRLPAWIQALVPTLLRWAGRRVRRPRPGDLSQGKGAPVSPKLG